MRRQRHRLAMTLQQLSEASGVSVGYLSQVETGKATPTLGTLSQIAAALEADAAFFILKPQVADSLTRADTRPQFAVAGSSIAYEQIGANMPGHELTSFVMNVPPGYESELVKHLGEEIIFILEGEISQMVGGREYTLGPGDSLHYLGENPHCWSNKTDHPARIFWVGRMYYDKSSSPSPMGQSKESTLVDVVPLSPQTSQ